MSRRAPKRAQRQAIPPEGLARAFKGICPARVRLILGTIGFVRRSK